LRDDSAVGASSAQVLERSTWIPRATDAVFAFFADIGNLERITPPELRFRLMTPPPVEMRHGALIEFRLALYGLPFGWRTEISRWEPPVRFVDRQLAGPYAQWIHLHEFSAERGGTRMVDRVDYILPLGRLGRVGLPLVRRQLDRIFDFREATIQRLLG
jgi:ligand-binding SRPBCC domain-containing protein